MKVALLCFLLFAVCLAQVSQQFNVGDPLSLTQSVDGDRHDQYSDLVEDQVLDRSACRYTIHRVNSVRTNNGPQNSGTYFSVSIVNDGNQDINMYFGERTDDVLSYLSPVDGAFTISDVDGASSAGSLGTCDSGDSCTFIYKCALYPSESTLQVTLYTLSTDDNDDTPLVYDLSVTQFTDVVTTIGRTFTQTNSVSVPFDSNAIGGANYAQYYHELISTVAESAANTVLYVVVRDFDASVNGDATVCVSFDSIVSNVEDNANENDPLNTPDPEDDFETIVEETCTSYCNRAPISSDGDLVYIAIELCGDGFFNCGSNTDMWIGVRPPGPSGFRIEILPDADTLPSLTTVNSLPFSAEGDVSGQGCDVEDFEYSCFDYYVVNENTNVPGSSQFDLGPFLIASVYGPYAGTLDFDVTTGTVGGDNRCTNCPGPIFQCSDLKADGNVNCVYALQPCQFNADTEYVFTVSGSDGYFADQPIEYGIDIVSGSYPVEALNPRSTTFGAVTPGQQNHYTVTFEADEIQTDSYFEVELYVRNSNGENLALAWNYGEPAGDGTCFDSLGICRTDVDCDSFDGINPNSLADGSVPACRFVYRDCPVTVSESFARSGVAGPGNDGFRISELRAGTYWFSVFQDGGVSANTDTSVEYTLKLNLRRSVRVFDDLVTLGQVHFAETTPQHVFAVPNTPSVSEIIITIDNVRNGGVTAYVECGSNAGTCGCGSFFASCSAVQSTADGRCTITYPVCQCAAGTLNIAIEGTTRTAPVGFSVNQPIFYALSVEVFYKDFGVVALPATRAGTTTSASLVNFVYDYGVEALYNAELSANVYELTFDNVDTQSGDALFLTLNVVTELQNTAPERVFMYVGTTAVYRAPSTTACNFLVCEANSPSTIVAPFTSRGEFSTCTIDLQACATGCGDNFSFDATQRYLVSVVGEANAFEDARTLFSVTAQIVSNTPLPLSVATPVRGEAVTEQYNHFSFSVSSSPANSRLLLEAYSDAASFPLNVYANYFDGVGSPILAGEEKDCYGQYFCNTCTLSTENNNRCGYEVPPCVLSTQSGTYYLSVVTAPGGEIAVENGVTTEDRIDTPGRVDFTVEARFMPMIDLLDAERVLVGSLAPYESAYYRINVPTGDRDILRVEFEATRANLRVALTTSMPDQQCAGCAESQLVDVATPLRSIFYPCDLPTETLYLAVTVDPAVNVANCDRYDFIVHAHVDTSSEIGITLATNTSPFISRSFDSSLVGNSNLVLSAQEFVVYRFTVNAPAGDFLVVETDQDGDETYSVWLSPNVPFFPQATGGFFDRPAVGDCGIPVASCIDSEDDICQMVVEPCSLTSGTYYLTFSGLAVPVGEQTGEITINIRQYEVENLALTPSTANPSVVNTAPGSADFEDVLFRSFVTEPIGIQGGERLQFTSNNVQSLYVRYGSETDSGCATTCGGNNIDECTLFACNDVDSDEFYIFVIPSDDNSDVEITIARNTGNSGASLSVTQLDDEDEVTVGPLNGDASDFDAEFVYYSFSVDSSISGRYEFTTDNEDVIYQVSGERTYMPGFTTGTDEFVIFEDGRTGTTCGGVNVLPPIGECCFEDFEYVFAVVGGGTTTFSLEVQEFGSNPDDIDLPEDISGQFPADSFDFDQYTFDLDNDEGLYFTFEVPTGGASLYLNQGPNAGSSSTNTDDPSRCFANDGIIGTDFCNGERDSGDTICSVYISPCDTTACVADPNGSTTYTFAVVPSDEATTYNLNIRAVDLVEDVDDDNSDLEYPPFDIDESGVDGPGGDVRSVFRYQVSNNVRSSAFIPRQNDLTDEDSYPRVTFLFSNFRDEEGNTVNNPFEFRQGGSVCATGNVLSDTFCDSDFEEDDEFVRCSVNVCSLSCGQEIFFSATSGDTDGLLFDLEVTEEFDDLDEMDGFEIDQLTVSSSATSSASYEAIDEIASVFIRTSFPGVDVEEYPVLTLSVDSPTNGLFTLRQYGADTCSGTPENVPGCVDLENGETCTVVFDPCTAAAFGFSDDRTIVYELVKEDDSDEEWSYDLTISIQRIQPIDSSLTRLSASGPTSYSATNTIFENTWQFYEFEIETNTGYTSLDVTVNNIVCDLDSADGLDVYYSWGIDNGRFTDVARPNRFPTEDCHVQQDLDIESSSSADMDTCQFNAGIYRVGIFANEETQLFDDDDDQAAGVDQVVRPIVYDISAQLSTLDHLTARLGCFLVQSSVSLVNRIEIPIEATDRRERLVFTISATDGTATLVVGRDGYPEGRSTDCQLNRAAEFTCTTTGADNACVIEIDACDYQDGLWFAFLTYTGPSATVTFAPYLDYSYTPVHDLAALGSLQVSALLPQIFGYPGATTDRFQYHKLLLDGAYQVVLDVDACESCTYAASFYFGESNACTDPNCVADLTCTFSAASPCTQILNNCNADVVYIRLDDTSAIGVGPCEYQLRATPFNPASGVATVLTPGEISCDITGCDELFELRVPGQDISNVAISVEVENFRSTPVNIFIDNDFTCTVPSVCTVNEICTSVFSGCTSFDGPLFVYVQGTGCLDCLSEQETLSVSFTVTDISIVDIDIDDEPLTAPASQVRVTIPNNDFALVTGGRPNYVFASAPYGNFGGITCDEQCKQVIPGGQTVIFDNVPAGFAVTTLDVENLSGNGELDVVFTQNGQFVNFVYNLPSGVDSVEVQFVDVNFAGFDADELSDLFDTLTFASSTSTVPYSDGDGTNCASSCSDMDSLTAGTCDRSFGSITVANLCGADQVYFSLATCEAFSCPLSLTVRVVPSESSSELIDGGSHLDNFITVDVPSAAGVDCSDQETLENLNFVVEVSSILYVSVREPLGSPDVGGLASVTATYQACGSATVESCTAEQTTPGQDASCAIGDASCNFYCVDAGLYNVDFTPAASAPSRFQYQIITEWVSLTSSRSSSLYGESAHFYEIPNANQALSISLTIESGPAVEFTVSEGCAERASDSYFAETQVCHFGTCHVWLPTRAKNPQESSLYVVIDSGRLSTGVLFNDEAEKSTIYEINVVRGTANCGSAPNTGFCADSDSVGVNAFAQLSNPSVWQYSDLAGKNEEASCLYDSFNQGCSVRNSVCRGYLKTLACLITFPQCDSAGYQMGVCNDICRQVVDACGEFDDGRIAFACGSARYAPASNGTCVNNLPINGVASPSGPARRVEAVDAIDVLPAQLIVPQFPPIIATLPTLILDDDDNSNLQKFLGVDKQVQASSASAWSLSFAVAAIILLAL